MKNIQRKFRVSDETLIEHAEKINSLLTLHHEKFLEFNEVKYSENYLSYIESEISRAKESVLDSPLLENQTAKSSKIKKKSRELITTLQHIRIHVVDTFEENPTKVEEFNLSKITARAANTDSFISYCKEVLETTIQHCKALMQNGLREEILNRMASQLEELNALRREQLDAKHKRASMTLKRVTLLNDLWTELRKIRDASKLVFFNNDDIIQQFELPKNAYGKRGNKQKQLSQNEKNTTIFDSGTELLNSEEL